MAFASAVEFAKPVMFSNGMFNPLAFKKANIAGADSIGLAVSTNMFLELNLPCSFKAF